MYFGVQSAPRDEIENNVTGLAKAAKLFGVPCVLTTIEAQSFSGPLIQRVQAVYPDVMPIDRTSLNAWEDQNLKKAVVSTGRKKIILAGLWTEVCVTLPALSMLTEGYEVFAVIDASGGASKAAHKAAVQRMVQAGVNPVTWLQVMLEWQRDWNDKTTYAGAMTIIKEHGGAYGLGVEYTEAMQIGG
jgi:nicotinamidase-related amidase